MTTDYQFTMVVENRKLYALFISNGWDKPVRTLTYYPLYPIAAHFPGIEKEGRQLRPVGDHWEDATGLKWIPVDNKMTADFQREEPIPPPRKKQVKYERGNWYYYTQTKGWTVYYG